MEIKQCPVCGNFLEQKGADMKFAFYRCVACGHELAEPIGDDAEAAYALRKRDMLTRLNAGLVDWRVTQWDRLHLDLVDFINRYEVAQLDIQLQMGLVACMTKGFNTLDAETYKKCKILFKTTEKMYKMHLKTLKEKMDPSLYESVNDYQESRAKYKACRNQFRNTKMAWKALFFLLKKFVPLGI